MALMPILDHVAILKIPAGGTAHFANTALNDVRYEAERDSIRVDSLWLYLPISSDPDHRYSLETFQKLKDLSAVVVDQPRVVREVQQLLRDEHESGVAFFAIEHGKVVRRAASSTLSPRRRRQARACSRGKACDAMFSIQRTDLNVSLTDLWGRFREALGVVAEDPPIAPRHAPADGRPQFSVRAAMSLRDEFIARGWPTSAEVGRANGSASATNPAQWASSRRDAGALLGAWSAKERTFRHPDFQFDPEGHLKPAVKELLAALATHADLTAKADKTGWRRVFWLYGAVSAFGDTRGNPRSAAEEFASDPEAVIAFARKEAAVNVNDVW